MSEPLESWKDIPILIIAGVIFLGSVLLINKGCAHLAGSDKRQELQVKQLEALGMPENTQLIDKFDSTPSYNKAWITYSYDTSLSYQEVFDYYITHVVKNNWICHIGCESEIFDIKNYDPEEGIAWYQKDHYLRLFYGENKNQRLIYSIDISWRRNKRTPSK